MLLVGCAVVGNNEVGRQVYSEGVGAAVVGVLDVGLQVYENGVGFPDVGKVVVGYFEVGHKDVGVEVVGVLDVGLQEYEYGNVPPFISNDIHASFCKQYSGLMLFIIVRGKGSSIKYVTSYKHSKLSVTLKL